MIATAEEYLQQLWQLYDGNVPVRAILLPNDENIYEVDLNTRTIKSPYLLGLKKDQAAETIYFLVDRFHGEVDLANTACLIIYKNQKEGNEGFYPVPFYDLTTYASSVTNDYIEVDLNEHTYRPGNFYTQNGNQYEICNDEEFDFNKVYYKKNNPSLNKRFTKANVNNNNYQIGKFHIIDESFNYVLATGEYNPEETYYIEIDKRYINSHVEYSNYRRNIYYILNSANEMVLATGEYNKNETYYSLIDRPKILFPWTIGGNATENIGELQFAIRFYQVDDEQLVYNLNTKPAKTRIEDSLIINIEDEEFETESGASPSNAPDYWEFLNADASTVLEDIYFRLSTLQRQNEIYWIEA